MRLHTRLTITLAVAALVVLSGCAPQQPPLDAATADPLNATVLAVATAADGDDPAGALAQLDALQGQLDAAVAGGTVTGERAAGIQSAIDRVRLDLAALVALIPTEPEPEPETPTPTPTPTVTSTENPDDDEKPGKPEKPDKPAPGEPGEPGAPGPGDEDDD